MYNRSDYNFALAWTKKILAINDLGGKCIKCGNSNVLDLVFHHCDKTTKEFNLCDIKDNRYSDMQKEICKCVLLCRNCHNKEHMSGDVKNNQRRDIKLCLLNYKGKNCCEICGYNDNISSLSFHHRNPEEKKFEIHVESWKYKGRCNLELLIEKLGKELDRCDVLCCNCHGKKHIDLDRFERLKDLIYKRVISRRERPRSYVERVKKMYEGGSSQIEIVRELKCAKSTVCEIIKRHNLTARGA